MIGRIAVLICSWVALCVQASAVPLSEADKKIDACLSMGPGVPSELAYKACITAFDTAIEEAQKTNIHSEGKRQLLWLQASKAASLALLKKVSIDNEVSLAASNIALNGLKADNQLTDAYKKTFKDLRSETTLLPIYNHCSKNSLYPGQQK